MDKNHWLSEELPLPEDVNDESNLKRLKPDKSVTDDRKDRIKVVEDHKKIIAGDMLLKDVSLIRREVQEQGCRTKWSDRTPACRIT